MRLLPAFLDRGAPRRTPRLGAPPPRRAGDGPPMVCRMIFDELCVLANGDVVCSCGDPAGLRVYGNVKGDRIADLYDGRGYREMRRWQLAARPGSFCPVINAGCGGRVSRAAPADAPEGRRVRTLQLEPVSHCNVRCPSCPATVMGIDRSYARDRRAVLPLDVMEDVIRQLPDLEKLLFFNFGEPFLHPYAVPFLRFVRRTRPDVTIHTSTNGLAFRPGVVEAIAAEGLLDRIVFSVDGARPESYERYRRGGNLGRALAAMRAMRENVIRAGTNVEVVWRYLLFAWNDGADELAEARALAEEIGVPLELAATHTAGASARFPTAAAAPVEAGSWLAERVSMPRTLSLPAFGTGA